MVMKQAVFITFEGIDGAGTTTQSELLSHWFRIQGTPFHLTREPSEGRAGKLIREYLSGSVDAPDIDLYYHSLALLFAADRLDHVAREICPCLERGLAVISDRYLLSSLVYQSLHCDQKWVKTINEQALKPDLTLLLDLPAETAMERLARRNLFSSNEIYETLDQQQRIRELYLKSARDLYSEMEILVIEAAEEQQQVHEQVIRRIRSRLERSEDKQ